MRSGMVVGLGTGSTAYFAVERVGEKVRVWQLKLILAGCSTDSHMSPSSSLMLLPFLLTCILFELCEFTKIARIPTITILSSAQPHTLHLPVTVHHSSSQASLPTLCASPPQSAPRNRPCPSTSLSAHSTRRADWTCPSMVLTMSILTFASSKVSNLTFFFVSTYRCGYKNACNVQCLVTVIRIKNSILGVSGCVCRSSI